MQHLIPVTQGILLQSIPYLGTGKILKIFTPKIGLISLFSKKKNLAHLSSPFCIGEWIYKKGLSDLYSLKDASLIDPLIELRQSFETLSSAGTIAQLLLKSQLPDASSEPLYALTVSYLKRLHQFKNPEILAVSFRCKQLLLEGLLSLQPKCTRCDHKALALSWGESLCKIHAQQGATLFTPDEWDTLLCIGWAKEFSLLQTLDIAPDVLDKIKMSLFTESF